MALRQTCHSYNPDVSGSWRWAHKKPDFERVRNDYDYVWVYRAPQLAAGFNDIGNPVYQDGDIAVYKIVHKTMDW